MFPGFELYMKVKIEMNAESPVTLIVRAEGHEKIDDLEIHGSWDHLKPSSHDKHDNCINLENENCARIIINELDGKKNF